MHDIVAKGEARKVFAGSWMVHCVVSYFMTISAQIMKGKPLVVSHLMKPAHKERCSRPISAKELSRAVPLVDVIVIKRYTDARFFFHVEECID